MLVPTAVQDQQKSGMLKEEAKAIASNLNCQITDGGQAGQWLGYLFISMMLFFPFEYRDKMANCFWMI
jgi:hypothetical protein